MVEVNDGGQVEINISPDDRRVPTSFSPHLVTFEDSILEYNTDGVMLAGGIVVVRNILTWARQLDPVACCKLLHINLIDGQVPHHKLLVKQSQAKGGVKAILADARLLYTSSRLRVMILFHIIALM